MDHPARERERQAVSWFMVGAALWISMFTIAFTLFAPKKGPGDE